MKLQKDFVVRIGGNDYADTPHLLACKGEPLLTVLRDNDSGELDVRIDIYDENGRKQAAVRQAALTRGSAQRFDIRTTENQFKIVDRKRDRVVCNIRRRAHARDMDIDVSLLMHTPEGFLVHANPDQTNLRTRSSEDILRGRDAALSIN
jgi:hypothetical protein